MVRNFGLDLLRAISIWLVLAQHGGLNIPGMKPLKIGGIGVEVFFVLSGFLIGGILFKEIDAKLTIKQTLTRFWTRRWFRILPLYYGMLLFKFIFIDHSVGPNILYYIFFLQNNFYGINFYDVTWSLVIEEWFYLFVPVFLIIVTRILKTESRIFISLIGFIFVINLMRLGYVLFKNTPYSGVNGNFPFRFDSLFLGVILAFLNHYKWTLFEKLKSGWVCLTGIGLFVSYLIYYYQLAVPDSLIDKSILPRTLGFFILPFSIALVIPFVSTIQIDASKNTGSKLIFQFVTQTSLLTYAIYLIHPLVFSYFLHRTAGEINIPKLLIVTLLVYGLAFLVYRFYEKPMLKLRDKIASANPGK